MERKKTIYITLHYITFIYRYMKTHHSSIFFIFFFLALKAEVLQFEEFKMSSGILHKSAHDPRNNVTVQLIFCL